MISKIHSFIIIPQKYTVKTHTKNFPFLELFHKHNAKMGQKNEFITKHTVCLVQHIYTSTDNFTLTLFVMFLKFRRSVWTQFFCQGPTKSDFGHSDHLVRNKVHKWYFSQTKTNKINIHITKSLRFFLKTFLKFCGLWNFEYV